MYSPQIDGVVSDIFSSNSDYFANNARVISKDNTENK